MRLHLRRNVLATALCVLALAAAACGRSDATATSQSQPASPPTPAVLLAPTPTPEVFISVSIDEAWTVSPSLEEQIFDSDVIVRASMASASTGTESVPSDPGVAPTYRPVQSLRFTVHEYLRGSGPTQISVVVRDENTYATDAEAQSRAQEQLQWRTTTWDDRQGVLFLRTGRTHQSGGVRGDTGQGSPATAFEFTLSNPVVQTPWDYSIDTLSRAWLPSSDSGGATGASGTQVQEFITDGTASPPSVISLADLRTKITELKTTLAAGAGVEGFRECIGSKIYRERHRRARPWTPVRYQAMLASGSPVGSQVNRGDAYRGMEYHRWWLSGPDMDLFQALVDDDDSVPDNGYYNALALARPLPAGEYHVDYNMQHYASFPCNSVPDDAYDAWTVAVTAPTGTRHEAFFDPVAIGSAVGADGSNGVLEPNAFSLDGATTTISSLKWQDGAVSMTLSPTASLADYAIDFIDVTGTTTLSLSSDNASTIALTWTVPDKPWSDGDLLMLRIHKPVSNDATLSGLALSGVDLAFDPATTTYAASVPATTTQTTVTPTTNHDSATYVVKLAGVVDADGTIPLAAGDNVITVDVTAEDGVTTETYTVTVTRAAPQAPVTVTLAPRPQGSATRVNITIEWNDPQTCDGEYLVALYTSADYMVQFLGYTPASETPSRTTESATNWVLSRFPDWFAGVTCYPNASSDPARDLGRVSLRDAHPDSN